jgi:hypothetical protein
LAEEANEVAKREHVSDELVSALFEQAADAAKREGLGGLLVVLDESGKFSGVRCAAPEAEDLFVMQGLAEVSARSLPPILLVTLLHTAFAENLGASADESRRAEWQKVQGRFADVAFHSASVSRCRAFRRSSGSCVGIRGYPRGYSAHSQHLL